MYVNVNMNIHFVLRIFDEIPCNFLALRKK